jgi:hypothetical protein
MHINDALLNMLKTTPHKEWPLPDITGTMRGKQALIVGSGRCVWEDLALLGASARSYDVFAINDIIMHLNLPVAHAVSNDAPWLSRWVAARRPYYRSQVDMDQPIKLHSNKPGEHIDYVWAIPGTGTSGLTAALIVCAMGYDMGVLAGVPMDGTDHYFDPPASHPVVYDSHNYAPHFRHWERAQANFFEGKIRSVSGNTRELLGAP